MSDGTPNGYARLTVKAGGQYALSWHPARLVPTSPAVTAAMHLHAPKVLRRGAYPAWGVYANVYMGRDDSRVPWKLRAHIVAGNPEVVLEIAQFECLSLDSLSDEED